MKMRELSYEEAFDLMTKKAENVVISSNNEESSVLTLRVDMTQDDIAFKAQRQKIGNFVSYDEAMEQFKNLFAVHFLFAVDITSDVAVHELQMQVAKQTTRGMGNCMIDNEFIIYTNPLTDLKAYDGPFIIVEKDGKYFVDSLNSVPDSPSPSDYGFRVKNYETNKHRGKHNENN